MCSFNIIDKNTQFICVTAHFLRKKLTRKKPLHHLNAVASVYLGK